MPAPFYGREPILRSRSGETGLERSQRRDAVAPLGVMPQGRSHRPDLGIFSKSRAAKRVKHAKHAQHNDG
jgi:hypothetical protein